MKIIQLLTIFLLIILLGGCFVNPQKFDDETIMKAKESVEDYIHNNFDDIETIEFDDDDYSSPMGGMMIDGKVNGSSKFSADVDEDTFEVGSFGKQEGFPPVKKGCEHKVCE